MWRCGRFRWYKLGGNFPGWQQKVDVYYDSRGSRGKVRSIRLTGVTGRGDVKEVEICCIPARRERVHGVWSEYPLIHTNTLPTHYTLPLPCLLCWMLNITNTFLPPTNTFLLNTNTLPGTVPIPFYIATIACTATCTYKTLNPKYIEHANIF